MQKPFILHSKWFKSLVYGQLNWVLVGAKYAWRWNLQIVREGETIWYDDFSEGRNLDN